MVKVRSQGAPFLWNRNHVEMSVIARTRTTSKADSRRCALRLDSVCQVLGPPCTMGQCWRWIDGWPIRLRPV